MVNGLKTKVSVIIPVYNVSQYLSDCMESVINQTYKNIEIICIEDCSDDCSLELLLEYEKKDSRVHIIQNETNKGLSYTRNVGINAAAGDYILFVDSDDYIQRDLVEKCLDCVENAEIVCFDYIHQYGENNEDVKLNRYSLQDGFYEDKEYFAKAVSSKSLIFCAWSRMYSRSFLNNNKIRFYEGILYEDVLFTFQCLLAAKKIYSLSQKLYVYRFRIGSIMTRKITGDNLDSYFFSICELTKLYLQEEYNEDVNDAVGKYIRKICREFKSVYCRWDRNSVGSGYLKKNGQYLKLYNVFSELCMRSGKLDDLTEEKLEYIRSFKYVILYGAGDIARNAIEILDVHDIAVYGIAVTSQGKNRKSLLGNPVRELAEYCDIRSECIVLLATTPKFYKEIKEQLQILDFTHYIELM